MEKQAELTEQVEMPELTKEEEGSLEEFPDEPPPYPGIEHH